MNAARRLTVAMLCALVGGLVFSSASAQAVRGHVFSNAFGSEGAGNGQLSSPAGVAVNEETGEVYVVDEGNNRVEWFSPTGEYKGQFDGEAAPTGRFSSPEAIAIDNDEGSPSFGDVYVADTGHKVIDKFSSAGAYIGQLKETTSGAGFRSIGGLAVDSSGKLWVCQEGEEIDAFSEALANEFLSDLTSTGLTFGFVECSGLAFAVDSNEDLYTRDIFTGIGKLNSSGGVLIQEFDSLLKEPDSREIPGAVAVDLSSNEVYIADADSENSVGRFSASGSLIESFGSEHLTKSSGIAADSKGEVYVADVEGDRVDRFVLEPESRPTVEREAPSEVAGTSATLGAQIKPTGPDTTYYFQYGTADCAASPASCSDLPTPPGVDIGGGFNAQSVSVHVQGLLPSTVYHFRVIATNGLGTGEGAQETFTTQSSGGGFALPDGRAWELVTPPDKQGAGLDAVSPELGADIQASEDGGAIVYAATGPIEANPAGNRTIEATQVISTRHAPGSWETLDITTPHTDGAAQLGEAEYKLFSSDLSLGFVQPEGGTPLPPLSPGAEKTVYLRAANGEYKALVTSANVPAGAKFGGEGEIDGVVFVTATPDLSHIVLEAHEGVELTEGYKGGGLYEWAEGQLRLASVLPNHDPAQVADIEKNNEVVRRTISDNGSRIIFKTGDEPGEHLYLRDMARAETIQLDAAEGVSEPSNDSVAYGTADSRGTRVFFVSPERLTVASTAKNAPEPAEHTGDLYEFEVTSGEGEPLAGKLTDLTVDPNAGEDAQVVGVIGASEDGSSVYFAAKGVLGDGAEHGAKSGQCEQTRQPARTTCNLYVDHYNQTTKAWAPPTFIAALSGADEPSWDNLTLAHLTSRVSPNGRYLAFMSEKSLTGYENRDANSGVPDEEVFLYDASTGRVVCTSCNPTGAQPEGLLEGDGYEENIVDYPKTWDERWLAGNIPGWTSNSQLAAQYQSRYLSNSGRLFFNSSDALVPGDVNGKEDVYEYEPAGIGSCQAPGYGQSTSDVFSESAGGCVALISSGTSFEESAFLDASETGSDVFFLTASRLVPQDDDASLDVYDAHECTPSAPCAAPPAAVPPPCTTADACRPAPTPQPAVFGAPSSATFAGAGNIVPPASTPVVTPRSSDRARKLASALKACRKRRRRKRATCESRARKRYAAKSARRLQNMSPTSGR